MPLSRTDGVIPSPPTSDVPFPAAAAHWLPSELTSVVASKRGRFALCAASAPLTRLLAVAEDGAAGAVGTAPSRTGCDAPTQAYMGNERFKDVAVCSAVVLALVALAADVVPRSRAAMLPDAGSCVPSPAAAASKRVNGDG